MCEHEIPLAKFNALTQLASTLGVRSLHDLAKRGKATYNGARFTSEAVESIASVFSSELRQRLLDSPAIGVLCDESDDASTTSQLVICVQYIQKNGYPAVEFAEITAPAAKDAATLMGVLVAFFKAWGIPLAKIWSFGSDGCSTMTGSKNGVATRLSRLLPGLVTLHCAAHRLALVPTHAVRKVDFTALFTSPDSKSFFSSFFFFPSTDTLPDSSL
jgi:hypothetical protein